MKRILHIVNNFDVGGMENGLVNLINFSNQEKFQHGVCALREIGRSGQRISNKATPLYSLKANGNGPNRFIFLSLIKVIKKFRPDIIHVRHWGPLLDSILAHLLNFRKSKLIFSYHGKTYFEYCNTEQLEIFKRRMLVKFVDYVVTLNDYMKKDLEVETKISIPITILPNGVDVNKFEPVRDREELKKKLSLPQKKFLFGTIGRLSKIKDIKTIIRACVHLEKYIGDNFALVVVGDGGERKSLEHCVKSLLLERKVFLIGSKQNINEYLNCFDVYVQASLYEGFSNTILEAMSCGLPVIATNVGGNMALVQPYHNGFLFSPGNDECLADIMKILYQCKKILQEFSQHSRKSALTKWSITNMIECYETFYLSI